MKKRFKDRKDGRRVDNISGMGQIMLDIKPDRCDSDVFINQKMDLTKLSEYIKNKKANGEDITFFHAFVAAIGMTFYNRKKLNYFVANRHLYEHNEVVVSFVAKVAFEDTAEEMMIMVPIKPEDNIYTISEYIKNKVSYLRNKDEFKKEGANSAIDTLAKADVNIRALSVGDTSKYGILRLIVSDNEKAIVALEEDGFIVKESEVIVIAVPDKPNGLNSTLAILDDANINLEYIYAFVSSQPNEAIVAMKVEDTETAMKVFEENNAKILKKEDLEKI